jgi:X-X-X-Leu-X-X-Gly heptad repeat protein
MYIMSGKKSFLKSIVAVALTAAVLLPAIAAQPASQPEATSASATPGVSSGKEEVVYAVLSPDGAMKNVYVVNVLDVTGAGTLRDFGDYTDIKNLTDTSAITASDGGLSVTAQTGRFYYQGTLKTPTLPWDVDVTYTLDGEKVPPAAIAGKSGAVKIAVKTSYGGVGRAFYDNYLLQLSLSLDTSICKNIVSDGATTALAGGDRMITHTVLPGQGANIVISCDAENFKMPGLEISAVPFSMASAIPEFDLGSIKDGLSELTDAIDELYAGAGELSDGASSLRDGAMSATSGSAAFKSGLDKLAGGSAGLTAGSSEILAALNQISAAVSASGTGTGAAGIGSAAMIPAILRNLAGQLTTAATSLTTLQTEFTGAYNALDAAIAQIPTATVSDASLANIYAAAPSERAAIDALSAYYTAGRGVTAAYAQAKPVFAGTATTIGGVRDAVTTVSGALTAFATQADSLLGGNDLTELTSGLTALAESYGAFHTGLLQYTAGVNGLADGYAPLQSGVSAIADGADGIASGLKEFHAGLGTLKSETDKIPARIDAEVKAITDSLTGEGEEFVPESFVSPRNENVKAVQFVIRTEKVELPAPPPPPIAPAEKVSFWSKLVALFG